MIKSNKSLTPELRANIQKDDVDVLMSPAVSDRSVERKSRDKKRDTNKKSSQRSNTPKSIRSFSSSNDNTSLKSSKNYAISRSHSLNAPSVSSLEGPITIKVTTSIYHSHCISGENIDEALNTETERRKAVSSKIFDPLDLANRGKTPPAINLESNVNRKQRGDLQVNYDEDSKDGKETGNVKTDKIELELEIDQKSGIINSGTLNSNNNKEFNTVKGDKSKNRLPKGKTALNSNSNNNKDKDSLKKVKDKDKIIVPQQETKNRNEKITGPQQETNLQYIPSKLKININDEKALKGSKQVALQGKNNNYNKVDTIKGIDGNLGREKNILINDKEGNQIPHNIDQKSICLHIHANGDKSEVIIDPEDLQLLLAWKAEKQKNASNQKSPVNLTEKSILNEWQASQVQLKRSETKLPKNMNHRMRYI